MKARPTKMALWVALVLALTPEARAGDEELLSADDVAGDFSASVTFTTEYLFRGLSQTDGVPAIQGSLDYAHDIGFYAGVWASNVNFTDASIEIDYYGGVANEFSGVGWDVGVIYYQYPGAEGSLNYDYWELAGSLGYDFGPAEASAGLNYSPDYFAASDDAVYYWLDVGVPLVRSLALGLHVGRQEIDDNAAFGTPDYTEWAVALSAVIFGFDVEVSYHDTDMSESECGEDLCDAKVLLTISRSF